MSRPFWQHKASLRTIENNVESSSIKRIIIVCLAVLCVQFARNYFNIAINLSIYTIIIAIGFLTRNETTRVAIIAYTIPFCNNLPMNEIVLAYVIIETLSNYGKLNIKYNDLLIIVVLVILELINCLLINQFPYRNILYLFLFFVATMQISSHTYFLSSLKKIGLSLCLGTISFGVLLFVVTVKQTSLSYVLAGGIRLGRTFELMTIGKLASNPNSLAIYCVISLSILLMLLPKKQIGLYLFICLSFACVFVGLLSQSRAFVVGVVLTVLLFSIFMFFSRKEKKKYLFLIAITTAIFVMFFIANYAEMLGALSDRFRVSDITNGRFTIFNSYLNASLSNARGIIFGYGLNTYKEALSQLTFLSNSAHNVLLEVYLSWGLIGIVLVIKWIYNQIKRQQTFLPRNIEKQKSILTYLPIAALFIMLQSSRMFLTRTPLLLLGVCLLMIRIDTKEGQTDKRIN